MAGGPRSHSHSCTFTIFTPPGRLMLSYLDDFQFSFPKGVVNTCFSHTRFKSASSPFPGNGFHGKGAGFPGHLPEAEHMQRLGEPR